MNDAFELPFPQYRCPACGKDLPLGEARMSVTCGSHNQNERGTFSVRKAGDGDRNDIALLSERALGETDVDVFGTTFDILSVYPDSQGKGAGSALLSAADELAASRNLGFMRVAVTNDDIPLLYFYQRHGFAIYEVAVGEVADRFGAATPGFSGIPVRDEIRLRRAVCAK